MLEELGERPSKEHTLDRINNDGNYEPGNLRWATKKEQGRNTSVNVKYTYKGETLTEARWEERTGVSTSFFGRRRRKGWNDEDIIEAVFKQAKKPLNKRVKGKISKLIIKTENYE